jgi:hypothetical protein
MDLMEIGCDWEVDGTGSGSCAVVGFGISGVELLCSAARELVN